MKPKFLADENFNHRIISGLQRREPTVDFRTAEQEGIARVSDSQVLVTAARLGRILVSHDRRPMPSCFAVFIRTRTSSGLIEDLVLISATTTLEEWKNTIGFIPI